MNTHIASSPPRDLDRLRDDFIPVLHYTSPEFAQREREKLWPRTWQMVCRLEEIPKVGSFTTYEILDESIVIVRAAPDRVNAFHNVCPHRGNQIVQRQGTVQKLTCRFHGWTWDLEGDMQYVKDREDWAGCPAMKDSDLALKPVQVGLWGGFVFVNFDPHCEPFEEFIAPVPQHLDCLEFEKMNFIWYKTMKIHANWKTALEAFMESYHVAITHAQTVPYMDSISVSYEYGKHGRHGYPNARPLGAPAPMTGEPVPGDLRPGYVAIHAAFTDQIGGAVASYRSKVAMQRLLDELPPEATHAEIMAASYRLTREAALAEGADIAAPMPEQAAHLGVDWNIFPNMVLVFGLDCTLVFRARPDPDKDDPNYCLFDMWGLLRQGPEKQAWTREFYESWREHRDDIPYLLVQDLLNMENIQRGMRSSAYVGVRTNPVQERQIINNHRQILKYIERD